MFVSCGLSAYLAAANEPQRQLQLATLNRETSSCVHSQTNVATNQIPCLEICYVAQHTSLHQANTSQNLTAIMRLRNNRFDLVRQLGGCVLGYHRIPFQMIT